MQHESKLRKNDTLFLLIDIQERLLPVIHDKELIEKNAAILAQGAGILDVPVIISEQYPKGLGSTTEAIRNAAADNADYYPKTTFSCLQDDDITKAVRASGKSQILLCGIETHICVCQTALDLAAGGYQVHIAADATGSRQPTNREYALDRLSRAGIVITNTESALFELLNIAQGDEFKAISRLIK